MIAFFERLGRILQINSLHYNLTFFKIDFRSAFVVVGVFDIDLLARAPCLLFAPFFRDFTQKEGTNFVKIDFDVFKISCECLGILGVLE